MLLVYSRATLHMVSLGPQRQISICSTPNGMVMHQASRQRMRSVRNAIFKHEAKPHITPNLMQKCARVQIRKFHSINTRARFFFLIIYGQVKSDNRNKNLATSEKQTQLLQLHRLLGDPLACDHWLVHSNFKKWPDTESSVSEIRYYKVGWIQPWISFLTHLRMFHLHGVVL